MKNYITIAPNEAFDKVTTNFIYNRYDLQPNIQKFELLHYESKKENFYFEVAYFECYAKAGIWCLSMSNRALKRIGRFVFKRYKNINNIDFMNSYAGIGGCTITLGYVYHTLLKN